MATPLLAGLAVAAAALAVAFTTQRENAPADKVKEAHRKVMVANRPGAGESHYLASKINESKDVMLGKTAGGSSAF
ncbi:hypothetical protein MLD38_008667 [Melastoma candidum]|uniref:Uncharacterized protein n=1 Tax=Melastoma candidum TaxID=119954 RepID=A0ACB9RY48_9MYRT|nr:hypothetical protein MLD38_008667 [Melastoma candidum]